MESKILLVFDFDKTITQKNTDTVAFKMIQDESQRKFLRSQIKSGEWTNFMNKVFEVLSASAVKIDEIKLNIETMALNHGMLEIFKHIKTFQAIFDCIIISDSNSWFIDCILNAYNLNSLIKKVYTNKAHLEDNKLQISACHSHSHASCPVNMCKGLLLDEYLQACALQGLSYKVVCYIGDGDNDFCPCTHLRSSDYVFPRRGFPLYSRLNAAEDTANVVTAHIVAWDDGHDILNQLKLIEENIHSVI